MTQLGRARWQHAKLLLAAYLAWLACFEMVGRFAATLPTRDLTSNWDRAIPFVPAFIWPYEACYLLPIAALFLMKDFRRFRRALLAILLANVSAFAVYLLLPVAFPKPTPGSGLSATLVALEYAADFSPGANHLPSMHVAISWILVRATHRERGRAVDVAMVLFACAVTASTLFVKQHLIVDAAAGLVWGIGSYALVERCGSASSRWLVRVLLCLRA